MTGGRVKAVVFGIAVRRALYDYLRAVGLIMFILLAIAWTIDLARHFSAIRAAAELRDANLLGLLIPYLIQRAADIVARLLPMASLFGVVLAEIARRVRLESIILHAAGFSPLRRLVALLWLGLILGSLQGMLESRWRPAAVFAQIESGFGTYATWYRRDWLRGPVWFVDDDLALHAEVLRTDRPEMRNLLIFEGIREPQLTQVIAAQHGYPTATPQIWRLEDVRIWDAKTAGRAPVSVGTMEIELNLIPEQLSYYGIQEFNIPNPPLRALAAHPRATNATSLQTALWRRRTAWLLPGTFALLAAALSRLMFDGRLLRITRTIALAGLGYVAVVSVKVLWALGELGTLSGAAATLIPVIVSMLLAVGLGRR